MSWVNVVPPSLSSMNFGTWLCSDGCPGRLWSQTQKSVVEAGCADSAWDPEPRHRGTATVTASWSMFTDTSHVWCPFPIDSESWKACPCSYWWPWHNSQKCLLTQSSGAFHKAGHPGRPGPLRVSVMMMLALEVSCFMWICGPFNDLWTDHCNWGCQHCHYDEIIINPFCRVCLKSHSPSLSHSLQWNFAANWPLKMATQNTNKFKQGWNEKDQGGWLSAKKEGSVNWQCLIWLNDPCVWTW